MLWGGSEGHRVPLLLSAGLNSLGLTEAGNCIQSMLRLLLLGTVVFGVQKASQADLGLDVHCHSFSEWEKARRVLGRAFSQA